MNETKNNNYITQSNIKNNIKDTTLSIDTLINREYYDYYDSFTNKSVLLYSDPITNTIYDALSDDIYIGLSISELEGYKIPLEEYNDKLEKEIFSLPFLFAPDLELLSSVAEQQPEVSVNDSILNSNSLNENKNESNFESIQSQELIEGVKTILNIKSSKECFTTKSEPKKTDNYSFTYINKYIKTNFAIFDKININLETIPDVDELAAEYIGDNVRVTSIQNALDNYLNNESIPLKNRMKFVRFIKLYYFYRSYIDLYHDILKYGDIYCKYIYQEFINSKFFSEYPEYSSEELSKEKEEFEKAIQNINKTIKTSGNEINQNKCKELLETLVDRFIAELHSIGITWIPKKKEEARVNAYNITQKCELDNLIKLLEHDGIDTFYVESANSSIGKKLVEGKMNLSDIQIGEWDAGSGFKKGNLKILLEQSGGGKTKRQQENTLRMPPTKKAKKGEKVISINNSTLELFNLFTVIVSKDNKTLSCSYDNLDTEIEIKNGPQKLSVNAILKALGYPPLRSSSSSSDDEKKITDLQIKIIKNDIINSNSTNKGIRISPYNAMLVSLKTWTDLIQIVSLSLSKNIIIDDSGIPFKTACIISDRLCETTARMYGLGHVLLNQTNIITYYNYDINSRQLTKEQIAAKLNMYYTILKHKSYIIEYIDNWFDEKIVFMKDVINNTTEPRLYFILLLLINSYTKNKGNYIKYLDLYNIENDITLDILKQVPNTITKLFENITETSLLMGDFQELEISFSDSLKGLDTLSSRGGIEMVDNFLDTYSSIKQIIVNTYVGKTVGISDDMDKIINAYTAICIAYKLITSGRKTDVFKVTFTSIAENIIKYDKLIKCSEDNNELNEKVKELVNASLIQQIPIKLTNILEYIQNSFEKSVSINYLQQLYNVVIAFLEGDNYIFNNEIKYTQKIIFKDFLEYTLNTITPKMKTNFLLFTEDTSTIKCVGNFNKTHKNKLYSTTLKKTQNTVKGGSVKTKNNKQIKRNTGRGRGNKDTRKNN